MSSHQPAMNTPPKEPSAALSSQPERGFERLLQVLFEIGKVIGSDEDLSSLLARISELVCSLVPADACSIMLLNMERNCLLPTAAFGLRKQRLHQLSFRVGQGVAGWVAEHGEPALIDDVAGDTRYVRLPGARSARNATESMICVPLIARRDSIGVLTATSHRVGAFSPSDIGLLGFVAQTIALDIENARLRRLSVTDALTGAYNRQYLQQCLPTELALAAERGSHLSIAMIDVDHFKQINDQFGHDVGDRVLASVAHLLRSAIRADDMLVRYGGEEFLAVLPRIDRQHAREIGERMRMQFESHPLEARGQPIEVRISVGIAQHRHHGERTEAPAELIQRADRALYRAKGRGRNRVEVAE